MRVESESEAAGQAQGICCQPDGAGMGPGGESASQPADQIRSSRKWKIALILGSGVIVAAYVLLWSPWWYPLSDSSLYISVARNMDEGRGYTYMGRPHRMVMPLTPAMLWGLMQFSRSFGLMNASMIACMVGSFVFMYLTLKEWMDRRTALALTVVSALTYWQFRLATVIGSDQPFLLLYWMAMYFLMLGRRQPQRRLLWLALGSLGLLLGIGFRIAGVLLIPVVGLGLWLDYMGNMPLWRRTLLAGAVTLPLVLAGGAYWVWQGGKLRPNQRPRESVSVPKVPAASQAATRPTTQTATRPTTKEITGYAPRLRLLEAIQQSPGVMGRWLAEAVVAPSRQVFTQVGPVWEMVLGTVIAIIGLAGLWQQVRARNWWLVVPILYVLAFVAMWGIRYIPRYMVPVTPMVVLWLSAGTGAICARLASWMRAERLASGLRRAAMLAVPAIVLLCNLPILGAEVYVCRSGDFYGRLRQGATSELVDAAAYIRRRLPKQVVVCTNEDIRRREVHLLTGRAVAVFDSVNIASARDVKAISRFFARTGATCALIRYKGVRYPEWHFDTIGQTPKDWSWWGLYVWDKRRNRPVRINLPKDRACALHLPDSTI